MVSSLEDIGATQISILEPGTISAVAPSSLLDRLSLVAEIHVQRPRQVRAG